MKYLLISFILLASTLVNAQEKLNKSANSAFRFFDINQDGNISESEYSIKINERKEILEDEELAKVVFPKFEDYDLDQDGLILESEFTKGQKIFLEKQAQK